MTSINSNTPLSDLIENTFTNKPADKRQAWLKVLLDEEFETVGDLIHATDQAWSSLQLPIAIRDTLRRTITSSTATIATTAASTSTATTTTTPTSTSTTTTTATTTSGSHDHTRGLIDTRPLTQIDVVAFDVSSSMRSKSFDPDNSRLGSAKILFHTMVDKLVGHELPHTLGLVLFGSSIQTFPFVRDYEAFHDTLGNAEANEHSTKLFDGIKKAGDEIIKFRKENISILSKEEGCKSRIFCLTDGEDNASNQSYWEVAKFLQENDIILDVFPLATNNPTLQSMAVATGGLCLNVNDMEKGVGLFEREAILHIASREQSKEPLPKIVGESSIRQLATKVKVVEDVKSVVPQAMKTAQVMKKDDLVKAVNAAESSSSSSTTANSTKRILMEYRQILDNPNPLWNTFISADNTSFWKAFLQGPPGTPYEGGIFALFIRFPTDFPFRPPEFRFITPIYHCNINNDGKICLDTLSQSWSPALKVRQIMEQILTLLEHPNPDDALDAVKANVYSDDKDAYNRFAREATRTQASVPLEELKRQYQIQD
eukprot:TRINITY_DN10331_c0_g1_i1.p1 TRINITY_DN10331_c0_g1~~TRINITY_DN10331_c0_g1_i1.p1  ORF type:complete len:542 (+),score=96.15 TRINITY_DN10331_c0_g1_i1:31-1656(+)